MTASPGGAELAVEARIAQSAHEVTLDHGLGRFLRDPEIWNGRGWQAIEQEGDGLTLQGCPADPCRVRYRILLQEAAQTLRDRNRAFQQGGVLLAPPSSWLLRPSADDVSGTYHFTVRTPPGTTFVSGVFPSPDRIAGAYEADLEDLREAPYSGFGAFDTFEVPTAGGTVLLAVSPQEMGVPRRLLVSWVEASALAVAGYYGRFPVPRALVIVLGGGRRPIGFGTTMGNGGAAIVIWVGPSASERNLAQDWVLTHEMVHLGIPNVPRAHRWLEEGLATYIEPLARARQGRLGVEEVWRGLVRGLPNGLPEPGDQGLDRTHTWGRTYWGGALFAFLADLEIRQRTGGKRSLEDALRGIQQAGGSIAVRWPIERLLAEGDRAIGVPVLTKLYDRHANAAVGVDLPDLWRELGVRGTDEGIRFDERAPLAAIRRSMTSAPHSLNSGSSSDRR